MSTKQALLRIYTDEAAYFGDRRVYLVVAIRARDAGLAGATVLHALIGFGRSAHMRRRHVLQEGRSVVVEMVKTSNGYAPSQPAWRTCPTSASSRSKRWRFLSGERPAQP
jgi:PII-like signaling protein